MEEPGPSDGEDGDGMEEPRPSDGEGVPSLGHFGATTRGAALAGVSLRLQRASLALVVGPSGSGKTAMVRALVGAMDASAAASVPGTESAVAWCPQRPFIRPGTVLSNITGCPFVPPGCTSEHDSEAAGVDIVAQSQKLLADEAALAAAGIDASALKAALDATALSAEMHATTHIVGHGKQPAAAASSATAAQGSSDTDDDDDGSGHRLAHRSRTNTLRLMGDVGEGGRKLSGGQRARVALARALYQGRAGATGAGAAGVVVVADCPLDPLDGSVAEAVGQRVFGPSGALRRAGRAAVLVTRNERVVRLSDDGGLLCPRAGDVVCAIRPASKAKADSSSLLAALDRLAALLPDSTVLPPASVSAAPEAAELPWTAGRLLAESRAEAAAWVAQPLPRVLVVPMRVALPASAAGVGRHKPRRRAAQAAGRRRKHGAEAAPGRKPAAGGAASVESVAGLWWDKACAKAVCRGSALPAEVWDAVARGMVQPMPEESSAAVGASPARVGRDASAAVGEDREWEEGDTSAAVSPSLSGGAPPLEADPLVSGWDLRATPTGAVPMRLWWAYLRRMGGCGVLLGLAALGLLLQAAASGGEVLLSLWAHQAGAGAPASASFGFRGLESDAPPQPGVLWVFLIAFAALSVADLLLGSGCACLWRVRSLEASRRFVSDATAHVLAAPIRVHDSARSGDMVARLAEDSEAIDLEVPGRLRGGAMTVLNMCAQVAAIAAGAPVALPFAALLIGVFWSVASRFRRVVREVSRAEAATEGPLMTQVTAVALSASVVRAAGQASVAKELRVFHGVIDEIGATARAMWALEAWLEWRAETLGAVALAGLGGLALLARRGPWASQVPMGVDALLYLVVTYASGITDTLRELLEDASELEAEGARVERLARYAEGIVEDDDRDAEKGARVRDEASGVPAAADGSATGSEAAARAGPASELTLHSDEGGAAALWDHVSLSYAETSRPVLRDCSLRVGCGEVVGLCGRTGQGKSSLISAILGLYPRTTRGTMAIHGRKVMVDGVTAESHEQAALFGALSAALGRNADLVHANERLSLAAKRLMRSGSVVVEFGPPEGETLCGCNCRAMVAAVPQGLPIMGPTILDDVTSGTCAKIAEEDVWWALEAVGAAPWVRARGGLASAVGPEKDDSDGDSDDTGDTARDARNHELLVSESDDCSDGGSSSSGSSSSGTTGSDASARHVSRTSLGGLSEGQAQQLAAARALVQLRCGGRKLLLADECGSSLPERTAGKVMAALAAEARRVGAGAVLVAHALRPLAAAKPDRVAVLHGGVIVEDGNPAELLKLKSGLFRDLAKAQRIKSWLPHDGTLH